MHEFLVIQRAERRRRISFQIIIDVPRVDKENRHDHFILRLQSLPVRL